MTTGMSIRTEVCQIRGKVPKHFTVLDEKAPDGFSWSGERLTKVQTTTRPEHERLEVWTKIGKAAQSRENKNGQKRSLYSTVLDD